MSIKVDSWVSHAKFGPGFVLAASDDRAEVRFVSEGVKKMLLSHLSAGEPPTPGFKFPPAGKAPKGTNKSKKPARTFDHLLERFLQAYPLGFDDPKFVEDERKYKREASELFNDELSEAKVKSYIDDRQLSQLAKVASARVSRKLNLLFPNEAMQLNDGLKNPIHQERFGESLYELLYGAPNTERSFDEFVTVLGEMRAAKWTTATIYQFLASRGDRMFMKPVVSMLAADAVQISMGYQPVPTWFTYCKLQEVAKETRVRLEAAGLKPRDGIDVQSFMYVAWHEVQ